MLYLILTFAPVASAFAESYGGQAVDENNFLHRSSVDTCLPARQGAVVSVRTIEILRLNNSYKMKYFVYILYSKKYNKYRNDKRFTEKIEGT